jgi:hypothetical protein
MISTPSFACDLVYEIRRDDDVSDGSSTVADQKENLKLFNWLKSLKAT